MTSTPTREIRCTGPDAHSVLYTDMQEGEIDEVVEFLHEEFFKREPLAHGIHLTSEDVQDWLANAVHYWQSTGVSVVARDQRMGALIGVLLSLVLTKDGDQSLRIDRSKNEQESERRGQSLGCQAATVAASNIFTQRIFDKFGYQTIAERPMTSFMYRGVPCIDSTIIGNNTSAKMMVQKFAQCAEDKARHVA